MTVIAIDDGSYVIKLWRISECERFRLRKKLFRRTLLVITRSHSFIQSQAILLCQFRPSVCLSVAPKIATCVEHPLWGWPCRNFATLFKGKQNDGASEQWKNFVDTFSRFDTYRRVMDRQPDGHKSHWETCFYNLRYAWQRRKMFQEFKWTIKLCTCVTWWSHLAPDISSNGCEVCMCLEFSSEYFAIVCFTAETQRSRDMSCVCCITAVYGSGRP